MWFISKGLKELTTYKVYLKACSLLPPLRNLINIFALLTDIIIKL